MAIRFPQPEGWDIGGWIDEYYGGRPPFENISVPGPEDFEYGQTYMSNVSMSPVGIPENLDPVLTEFSKWGYSREELLYQVEQAGISDPATARSYLARSFGRMFGEIPAQSTMTPSQWRQTGAGRRAREIGYLPWGEKEIEAGRAPFPSATEWEQADILAGQTMVTRQGMAGFFPAQALMTGSYWLPGEEPGTVRIPIEPGKLAKRGQLAGAHEMLSAYDPSGGSMMQRGLFRSEGAPGYEHGFRMRALVPLTGVLPEGMGMIQQGAIGSFRQRMVRDITLPEGFEPTGMPERWQTFNLAAGEQVVPFEGGTPLNLGSWGQAQLLDVMRTEQGLRYVFERGISPEEGVSFKSFAAKAMMGVGDVAGFTGREDIQAVLPPKETLGLFYAWAQQLTPEQAAGYMGEGVTAADVGKMTWQQAGPQLLSAFTGQVLPEAFVPEAQFGERTSPALDLNLFLQGRREYPSRRPRLPYRELQKLRDVAPDVYEQVMAESAPMRAAYGQVLGAAAANLGTFAAPEGAITPTAEQYQALVHQARLRAQEATGAESLEATPRGAFVSALLNLGAETYGAAPLKVGQGQYLPSFQAMQRLRAPGVLESEEASGMGFRVAGAMEALGSAEAWEAAPQVQAALGFFQEMAFGSEFIRSATSAYLGPRAGSIAMLGSEKLRGAEIALPSETVLRGYGLKPGSAEAQEFLEQWNQGNIRPTALTARFPTGGKGPLSAGIEVLSPAELERRGVELSPESSTITSMGLTQMLAGDWDADMLFRYLTGQLQQGEGGMTLTGGLARATDEQIEAYAQQIKAEKGADVREELGAPMLGLTEPSLAALQQALDPSTWRTYTPQQIQEAYAGHEGMRQRIGPVFNLIESIQRAALDPTGEAAGEKLMGRTYGTMQVPKELQPAEQRLFDILRTFNPATGGYLTSGGEPGRAGVIGFSGLQAAITEQMAAVVQSGAYTPGQAAALLGAPGGAGQIQAAMEGYLQDPTSMQAEVAYRQAVGGVEEFARSPLGVTMPIAYRRMVRKAATPEEQITEENRERIQKTQRFLKSLREKRPELAEQLEQGWEQIEQWRAMMTKHPQYYSPQQRLEGLEQAAPELAQAFGIQSIAPLEEGAEPTAEAGAVPWYVQRGAATPEDIFGPATAEDADLPEPVAAGAAAGGAPPTGGTPTVTAPSAGAASPLGGGGGGGMDPVERYEKFMSRFFGVSRGKFETAVQGLSRTLEEWNESIRPKIEAGQELTKEERAITNNLAEWRRDVEQAIRQGGEEEWGPQMAPIIQAAQAMAYPGGQPASGEGYGALGRATREMEIQRVEQMLAGGDGVAEEQAALRWLSTAPMQDIGRALGPAGSSLVAGARRTMPRGGMTSMSQLWDWMDFEISPEPRQAVVATAQAQGLAWTPGAQMISALRRGVDVDVPGYGPLSPWQAEWAQQDPEALAVASMQMPAGALGAMGSLGLLTANAQDIQGTLAGIDWTDPRQRAIYGPYARAVRGQISRLRPVAEAIAQGREAGQDVSDLEQRYAAATGGIGLQLEAAETAQQRASFLEERGRVAYLGSPEVSETMEEFRDRVEGASERLRDMDDALNDMLGGRGSLSRQERQRVTEAQEMISRLRWGVSQGAGIGITPEEQARYSIEAIQAQQRLADIGLERSQQPPGLRGVGQRLMSGWGLMQMRRMWGLTVGYAMGQIPVAAAEEQAMMQAGMVGLPMGQYQPSGMALDIMGLQAQQMGFRADVGRAAYGAWGWTQGALGQGAATAAGIGLPAVGGGLVSGLLASWAGLPAMAIGAPVAAGLAGIGGAAYAREAMGDRERMAVAAAGGGNLLERALAGGLRRLEGRPALASLMLGQDLAFFGQDLSWVVGQQRGDLAAYGAQIREGDLEGLGVEGRATAIGEAARRLTRRGGRLYGFTRQQVMGQFADWARYTPETEDVSGMESNLFRTMMYRGETTAPYRQMAAQWGMDPTQWQTMAQFSMQMTEPQFAQFQHSSQFYAPFARFGMTPEQAAGMPNITNAQQGYMMRRLAAGSQLAWSQFGMDTGNQWAVTQDPSSGMGIGTNWGGGILSGRMGQVGAPGQAINISGGDITFNVTGQRVGFNQWDMEDYATGLGRGMQDWQYQFRTEGLDLARDWQYTQWAFQDESRALSRGYQRQQFGFQRQQMGMGDRQFRERWQLGWDRMMAQDDWAQEDREAAWQRQQTQFGWRLEDIAFRGARTSLQFGWQMEDLDEAERFATGRDRRRIRRQRERGAIQFGMAMGQLETQEGRTRQQMRWAEEEHQKARDRHNQSLQWRQREMQMQLRHHTERLGLQRRRQDAAERYFEATANLQDRQTKASRDYWETQHERQREAIEREREHTLAMREVQDAQTALRRAQQLQINEFRAAFESGGPLRQAWSNFVTWARDEINRAATSSQSRGYIPQHSYPRTQGQYGIIRGG